MERNTGRNRACGYQLCPLLRYLLIMLWIAHPHIRAQHIAILPLKVVLPYSKCLTRCEQTSLNVIARHYAQRFAAYIRDRALMAGERASRHTTVSSIKRCSMLAMPQRTVDRWQNPPLSRRDGIFTDKYQFFVSRAGTQDGARLTSLQCKAQKFYARIGY